MKKDTEKIERRHVALVSDGATIVALTVLLVLLLLRMLEMDGTPVLQLVMDYYFGAG